MRGPVVLVLSCTRPARCWVNLSECVQITWFVWRIKCACVCMWLYVCLSNRGGVCLQSRGLPADRRGACCFLLGMLLQDFPLDFSCRDQNSGRSWRGNRCKLEEIKASKVFPLSLSSTGWWELRCRSLAGGKAKKSLLIFFYFLLRRCKWRFNLYASLVI